MKQIGPGLVVTAAFIGPGTVATASMAGASFGYTLVWALLFSVVATYVLQEMASRLGLVTGQGLAETLRQQFQQPLPRAITIVLVVCAIAVGNSAYQGGNLTGAALGLANVVPVAPAYWSWLLGALAAVVLWFGQQKFVESCLIVLVGLMSLVFIVTMLVANPDWSALFAGFVPSVPDGATLSVIALIGTTVVPYNLFLHASAVAKRKTRDVDLPQQLQANRRDAAISIGLGGLVTLAVMSCAAGAFFAANIPLQAGNIAEQLTPLLGRHASIFFALGLFAAGLTSAITAPLAAAYAVTGILGWQNDFKAARFRLIWVAILLTGVVIAVSGVKPLPAILFAQAANGLLLPVIAVYLIWATSRYRIMGKFENHWATNTLGVLVVLTVIALGFYKLADVFI